MRIVNLIVTAVVGAAVGFAASQYVERDRDLAKDIDRLVDARVDARLKALGVESAGELDSRISGGVAQFLADQPEAIYGALERHQANVKAGEAEALKQTVADLGEALTGQAGDPSFGADVDAADVTLVEFFDYRCGYCKRALEGVMELTESDPKLRIVLKEFPILGPESIAAAQVSLAANRVDPKLHHGLHLDLMRHRGGYDLPSLLTVAADAGYDPAAVQAAMADDAIGTQIRNGYEIAEALGIRGTPAFVIGDQVIPGAVGADRLRAAIEAARAAKKG